MDGVESRATVSAEIDLIRPLREQLNAYHHARASRFRAQYERMTFKDRKSLFRLHRSGQLRIGLARDTGTGRFAGYCDSSLTPDRNGEIESLFVEDGHRSRGIGTAFVTRAPGWMDSSGAERKPAAVSDGNESAGIFFRKFGFPLRMTVLEQKTGPDRTLSGQVRICLP